MSHIVSIKTEVRDVAAIRAACRRLNIDQPEQGTFKLFSGEAAGSVKLTIQINGGATCTKSSK